jgi:hypothetical protein
MDGYEASTYGDRIADFYDPRYGAVPSSGPVEDTVTFLEGLAASGPALELGIGTGRVAPPAAAGVAVQGIDASEQMVERMRGKPGGAGIPVAGTPGLPSSTARLAGLRLRERWGGWKREPYTGEGKHVSGWERESAP